MEDFICKNCKYRFKSSGEPKTCPYCDKESVEKEKSASEIVNEIEDILN